MFIYSELNCLETKSQENETRSCVECSLYMNMA